MNFPFRETKATRAAARLLTLRGGEMNTMKLIKLVGQTPPLQTTGQRAPTHRGDDPAIPGKSRSQPRAPPCDVRPTP